jgi:AraC family transcriptional activator FtrA
MSHKVAILAHEHSSLFELACAVELFALPRPEFKPWYTTDVVSFSADPVNSTGGISLTCKHVRSLKAYDTIIIPSWPTAGSVIPPALVRELNAAVSAHKRILSFCSGAFLLAELGFLNGKTATTHWRYAEAFQNTYPDVTYVDNVLYLFDGNIGSSAGSAAGIDLGLEVIRQDFGFDIANKVARRLVVSAHRQGGQSQFVETAVPKIPDQFAESLDWAIEQLGNGMDVDTIALKANMSRRSFDRKFRATLNMAPNEWLTQQRVSKARELLETQPWGMDRISEAAGFETAVTMRHHFSKRLGVSPKQYRAQFGQLVVALD